MHNQYQKWVNISYLLGAVLLSYVFFLLMGKLVGVLDVEAKVKNIELIVRLGSLGLGAVTFFALNKSERINQFMTEVVIELSRVTWPTQKETSSATVVVVVMVLISGLVLGFLDYIWTKLLQWVI